MAYNNYSLIYTNSAENDLNNILNYFDTILHSQQAIKNFLNELDGFSNKVCSIPNAFNKFKSNLYRFNIKNFCVLYKILEDTKQVFIERIVYAKMDLSKL